MSFIAPLIGGILWTIVAFCAAYMAGVLAGLMRGLSWDGVGTMFGVGIVTFIILEIAGFYVIGILT